ncbi:hypothetical protein PTTG_29367 [Puccinia triticina 1-1 BBBD Race 1]|uniref:Uncharacterized protein n=1 Tax=Puccinia triticina (isolate 1-1 / race 1 (BBBD)) TaxID=630390 RepID=A0A180G4S7_PUCT1|nr:hypothetical protein PTTG_29367 [Puccinia triticina 1-1 BBBD Race 1]
MELADYDRMKKTKTTKEQYRRWRNRVRNNRCTMVDKLFKDNISLANIIENKECGSDLEDGDGDVAPASRIPDWRSLDLTNILHSLDKMFIAQGQHHRTIAANETLYARSHRNFKITKGLKGVPRGLPLDCYSPMFWKGLSSFEQETISKTPAIGLNVIAQNLKQKCTPQAALGPSGTGRAASSSTGLGGLDARGGTTPGGQSDDPTGGGSMHVDA